MNPFAYVAVTQEGKALDAVTSERGAAFIAGGTTILDLMKLGVERPPRLVDINKLPLTAL